jgi:hypothetical protein
MPRMLLRCNSEGSVWLPCMPPFPFLVGCGLSIGVALFLFRGTLLIVGTFYYPSFLSLPEVWNSYWMP